MSPVRRPALAHAGTRFGRDQRGGGFVEYGLVLVAIMIVVSGGFRMLGTKVDCTVSNAFGGSAGGTCGGATAVVATAGGATSPGAATVGAGGGGAPGAASPTSGSFSAFAAGGGAGGGTATGNLASAGSLGLGSGGPGGASSSGDVASGSGSKPSDATLADLSANVYHGVGPTDGFTRVSDSQLAAAGISSASLNDTSSGFTAAVYTDGQGNYVVAFAGTDDGHDVVTDVKQALGFNTAQYNEAAALAKKAKLAYGDNLVFTGHSLGGSLAATAALASNGPAVTFNAVGVSDNTIRGLGLDPAAARAQAANGQIRSYHVDGEIASSTANASKLLTSEAIGREITLRDPHPLSWAQKLIPGAKLYHSAQNHRMPNVLASIHEYPPWTPGALATR
ncbi:MAG: Mbeg1-like protein [Polyangiaceae bacterium]